MNKEVQKNLHFYVGNWTTEGLKLVTKVHYEEASVEWEIDEKPIELSIDEATDIAYGLSLSFYRTVVIASTSKINTQIFLSNNNNEGKAPWEE